MKNRDWKEWIKRAGVRAIKTAAQTFVASVGAAAVLSAVDWQVVSRRPSGLRKTIN